MYSYDRLRQIPLALGALTLLAYVWLSPFLYDAITKCGALLLLISISAFVVGKERMASFDKRIQILLLGFFLYIVCAFLSLINSQDWSHVGNRLERYIPFLASFFLLYLFINIKHYLSKSLLIGGCLGGVSVGLFALYQQTYLGMDRTGLGTGMGINSFAHMSSLLSTLLVGFLLFGEYSHRQKIIIALSAMMSIYAVFSTVSRLTLIALLAAFLCFFIIYFTNSRISRRRKKMILGISVFVFVLAGGVMIGSHEIALRMSEMFTNAVRFFHGDDTYTSTSARLMMWEGGFKMGMANFWFGTGVGDTAYEYKILMQTGQIPYMDQPISVLHNNFVDAFATTGIIGLLVMTASIIAYPIYLFRQGLRKIDNKKVYIASAIGMSVMVNNFVFGLGHSWLYIREVPYCLILTLVLIVMATAEEQ